ncbi:MAG: hypothetical protein NXH82_14300 [Rhodobacteraceae bacterium]|nr:hypothetical protein [Paracoccaceae bacterium]
MSQQELMHAANALEQQVGRASTASRCALQPAVRTMVKRFEEHGLDVPVSLRRLDEALMQDVIEARFDNMPV